MSAAIALDALDLAALLCSRVCHDLISPTGAIVNGLEVLEEKQSDEETKTFALDLIKKSAKTASARLQFCRLAFGAAGSSTAQIDLGDAQNMARAFLEDGKTKLVWNLPHVLMPKNRVKLLLNMLIIAGQTIPRGGVMTVDPIGAGRHDGFPASAASASTRAFRRRFRRCWRARRKAAGSMPTPSSHFIPGSWPARAGSASIWSPKVMGSWCRPASQRLISENALQRELLRCITSY